MSSASDSADDLSRSQPGGGQAMLARDRAKQAAEAQGQPAPKTGFFPLGYRDGFSQWWASLTPAVTENKVMSFVPYLQQPPTHTHTGEQPVTAAVDASMSVDSSPRKAAAPVVTDVATDPYGPRQWHSQMVQLAGNNRYLNEFSVERLGEETRNSVVMLHGYGAGLGFFFRNFEPLSRLPHWKLYALDLPGMGRSSRPPFKIHAKDKEAKVREAESWFVDALEEWRQKRGIDKMTLLGHSLGGYMAVCYALKYPGHLDKLILASPVGIPEDPYAVDHDAPSDRAVANGSADDPTAAAAAAAAAADKPKPPPRRLPKWAVTLWDANISPFSIVRLSGPLGPRLVSGWTSRRFSHLPPDQAQALHEYSYSLFRQRGSGEYALAYILAPGAFARSPLIRRIHGVGRQLLRGDDGAVTTTASAAATPSHSHEALSTPDRPRETGIPVVMMYGEHDWMDVAGGRDSRDRILAEKKRALAQATPEERERENGEVRVVVIRNAGHHLYLEGADQFNQEILAEMKDVEARQRRLAAAAAAAATG